MQKPKHLVRGLFQSLDIHQRVFLVHTIVLIVLFVLVPVIKLTAIESTTAVNQSIKLISRTFWKSDIIILFMIIATFFMSLHAKVRQMAVNMFGVNDVFVCFVCYLVVVGVYIAIGDSAMAVHLNLTKTIGLTSGYYVIGIWLALGLLLHASWAYKHGKQNHQATIINLAAQKHQSQARSQESFKNLFD